MQYSRRISYIDQVVDQDVTYDNIDMLFGQLQMVEPPPSLIAHMLNQVSSKTTCTPLFSQPMLQDTLNHWTVQLDRRKLC
jgi:hypothetical protein